MRRRSRMKALKILRLFAQGRIVVFLMIMLCTIVILGEPGYLDFDNLPETNFTCAGKVIGGYYADLETSCQMFHVCTIGQLDEPMDIKFLCLNGTVFDQETRVCERVDEVDCTKSERFYYLNLELYGNTMVPIPGEDSSMSPISSTLTSSSPLSITPSLSFTAISSLSSSDNHNDKDSNDDDGDGDGDGGVDHDRTSTSPTMYSSTLSTIKPIVTTLTSTTVKATVPNKINNYSNTTTQQLMTTSTTVTSKIPTNAGDGNNGDNNGDTDDEYDYDDEFLTTDGIELQSYQNTNSQSDLSEQVFSPEQFIFHQNINKNQNKDNLNRNNNENTPTNGKPAISFQQQQFQNGDSLTVTNSHVTITTHTANTSGSGNGGSGSGSRGGNNSASGSDGKPTKQFSSKPKEVEEKKEKQQDQPNQKKSSYGNGGVFDSGQTAPPPPSSSTIINQRQPLKPPALDNHGPPLSHAGLPSRLAAHGFRLPSQQKDDQIQIQQHKYEPSFEEQHQRYLEQHQRHLEQLQQQEHDQQQKQQEDIRKQQEKQRQEQERLNQQREKDNLKLELDQQSQVSATFEGYRRFTPQIPLRLPFEESTGIDGTVGNDSGDGAISNSGSEIDTVGSVAASGSHNQPEFLVFDQTDLDFPLQEHKDLKRSDPPRDRFSGPLPLTSELNIDISHNRHPYHQFHRETILNNNNNNSQINDQQKPQQQQIGQPQTQSIYHQKSPSSLRTSSTTKTTSSSSRRSSSSSSSTSNSNNNNNINNNNNNSNNNKKNNNNTNQPKIDIAAGNIEASPEREEQKKQHQHHHHQRINQNNNKYDKVLLTLQDQYIPSLPKVIITASASVSDGSGKILNYSVGNIVGSKIKIPPSTYDEYKEDDVVLDPFFLDVPKIKQRRTISSTTTTSTTTQRQSG